MIKFRQKMITFIEFYEALKFAKFYHQSNNEQYDKQYDMSQQIR